MTEFIRTFIAIEPDENAKKQLAGFTEKLKRVIRGDINWTKPQNLHFTLKFLGEISPEKIEDIKNLLNTISRQHDSFSAKISGIGFFPDEKRPRILWAGLQDGREEMIGIAKSIEDEAEYLGFEREEREFRAHITIARIRDRHIRADGKTLKELSSEEICSFTADRIILFRSDLLPNGPRYSILAEFVLNRE